MDLSSHKVLIVDDELEILKALNRDLRKEPYEKIYANSGEQALIEFESNPDISVVVTDMRMPGMTGLELLAKVHEINPNTVKIVLTGYTQLPQIVATINKVDIYKFLTKPWDIESELKVFILEGIEIYEKRKNIDSQVRSQEQKTKIFNKMLIDSYEKADFLMHLFEELQQATNYNHIMTLQEMRQIEPTEAYETSLRQVFQQMKERMHFINKVFDINRYGIKSFHADDLIAEMTQQMGLPLPIPIKNSIDQDLIFQDNIKFIVTFFSDFIEAIAITEVPLLSIEMALEEQLRLKLIVSLKGNDAYDRFVNSRGKFMSQIIKTLKGTIVFERKEMARRATMLLPVRLVNPSK